MPKAKSEYIVYDNRTTLPVFIGDIHECADYTGMTVSSLRTFISKKIESGKYSIYNMDKLLKDYEEEMEE